MKHLNFRNQTVQVCRPISQNALAQNHQVLVDRPALYDTGLSLLWYSQALISDNNIHQYIKLTIDFAIAFVGVVDLLENKNLVYLGTSIGKGFDAFPFATGTCIFKLQHGILL